MDIRDYLNDAGKGEEVQSILTAFEKWIDRMITNAVEKALNASQPTAEEPIWLSSAQVCERLDIDRSTLWRWSKEGYLPGTKFGNRVRYKQSDVERVETAEK